MDRPTTSGGAPASTPQPDSRAIQAAQVALAVLSRDELFSDRRPISTTEVVIEGWGKVRVASMLAGQHEEISGRHEKDGVLLATVAYMAEVVAGCLITKDGDRMFTDLVEGAKQVRKLDLPVMMRLWTVAAKRSAMTQEAVEEQKKDSSETPVGGD